MPGTLLLLSDPKFCWVSGASRRSRRKRKEAEEAVRGRRRLKPVSKGLGASQRLWKQGYPTESRRHKAAEKEITVPGILQGT